jgi:hypothetical protein
MLKQFRDAQEPDRACYQSLIHEPWTLSRPGPVTWLEEGMAVHIYRYPSLPLVEKLALQCPSMVPPGQIEGAIADVLYPECPFRITLDVEIGLGEVLSHSAGILPWKVPPLSKVLPVRKRKEIEKILADLDLAGTGLLPLLQAFLGRTSGGTP